MTPRRITLSLSSLQEAAHRTAVEKGWWENPRQLPECIALMHSELSESLEEVRKPNARAFYLGENDKPEGWAVELADCIIRILDVAAYHKQDMQALVEMKMKYNETRPYKHGKVL
jgi:NTP pyrophosphatase (non-canonical NTP hydrolase)